MTMEEALRLVATLKHAFPETTIPVESLEQYAKDLIDLDAAVAEEAVEAVRLRARFWPRVGEIREKAGEIVVAAPAVMEAWAQASEPKATRHPLVDQAREIVGDAWYWKTAASDDLRPAFIGAYKEIRAEAIRQVVERPGWRELSPTMAALPVTEQMQPREGLEEYADRVGLAAPPTDAV